MRVLHCIHSLEGGGAERQLRLLVKSLVAQGVECGIFCVDNNGAFEGEGPIRLFVCERSKRGGRLLFHSITQAVKRFRPSIIHCWIPPAVSIPTVLVAAQRGIPCICSYRNTMRFDHPLRPLDFLVTSLFAARIVTNSDVAHSSTPHQWLYRKKNGVEIANAVEVDPRYKRDLIAAQQEGLFRILFVGRLTFQKNWVCLLRALLLLPRTVDWECLICGEGEDRDNLVRMTETLGIADRVKMLGFRRDVYEFMRSANVLAVPSWFEGMPNVMLEAFSIGLPAVVSDIHAHRRIIRDEQCALVFDPRDPVALAERLQAIAGDPDLALGLAESGRRMASLYTPVLMASEYRELYLETLDGAHKGIKGRSL